MMNENSKGSNKKGAAAVACAVLLASGNDRIRKRWAERPNPLYRSSTSATHPNLDAPRRSPKNSTNRMVSGFRTAYQRLILMRFQDEPNSGRVSAWQDHAGLIHSLLSGRN